MFDCTRHLLWKDVQQKYDVALISLSYNQKLAVLMLDFHLKHVIPAQQQPRRNFSTTISFLFNVINRAESTIASYGRINNINVKHNIFRL